MAHGQAKGKDYLTRTPGAKTHAVSEGTFCPRSTVLSFPLRLCTLDPFVDEKRTYRMVPEIIYLSHSPTKPGAPSISESSSLTPVSGK